MIYLDYAANTPVDKDVLDTFNKATIKYIANPNSSHKIGAEAKNAIDEASHKIGAYFNTDGSNVIYTSGSSESNNLVLKGIASSRKNLGNKIIISALEHSSIVAPANYLASNGFDVEVIPLKENGLIDLDVLESTIDSNTILVSICSVDSEVGTVQPISEIAKIVSEYPNCVFHTDATQAIGKVDIDFTGVDFVTFAPHKFFGLNGFGVLVNINNIKLAPLIHGGRSTTVFRSGTPVTANVLALEKAFTKATSLLKEREIYIKKLNNMLREELSKISCVHINSNEFAIYNTLNISLVGVDTKKVLKELEDNEIYLSTVSACSMGGTPSKSVLAITKDEVLARNTIRISISHMTTVGEINKFIETFKKILENL